MVLGWNHKKTMAPRRQFAQDYSIINGKNAAKGQFPYQVILFIKSQTLISLNPAFCKMLWHAESMFETYLGTYLHSNEKLQCNTLYGKRNFAKMI